MKARLVCKHCGGERLVTDEPRQLADLRCTCGKAAEARASEDFASALEDALVQLWHLSRDVSLEVTLSTESIPPAFVPQTEKKN